MSKLIRAIIDIATALSLEVEKGNGKIEILIPSDISEDSNGAETYASAIKAIMESDADDFYKNEAVAIVKKGRTSDYYGAIVAIVENSDDGFWMCSDIRKLD